VSRAPYHFAESAGPGSPGTFVVGHDGGHGRGCARDGSVPLAAPVVATCRRVGAGLFAGRVPPIDLWWIAVSVALLGLARTGAGSGLAPAKPATD
jgi:hypothetical protein